MAKTIPERKWANHIDILTAVFGSKNDASRVVASNLFFDILLDLDLPCTGTSGHRAVRQHQ